MENLVEEFVHEFLQLIDRLSYRTFASDVFGIRLLGVII